MHLLPYLLKKSASEIKWYILELYLKAKRDLHFIYTFLTLDSQNRLTLRVLHFIICKSVVLNQKTISSSSLFDWRKKQASLRTSVRTSDLPLGPSHLHFFPHSTHLLSCPSSSCWKYSGVRGPWGFTELFFLQRFVVTL